MVVVRLVQEPPFLQGAESQGRFEHVGPEKGEGHAQLNAGYVVPTVQFPVLHGLVGLQPDSPHVVPEYGEGQAHTGPVEQFPEFKQYPAQELHAVFTVE